MALKVDLLRWATETIVETHALGRRHRVLPPRAT
jgi:hypothetical protein